MHNDLQALTEKLAKVGDSEAFWDTIAEELKPFGVETMLYSTVFSKHEKSARNLTSRLYIKTNYRSDYVDHFGSDRFLDNEYSMEFVTKGGDILVWHDEANFQNATEEQIQQAHIERDFNLHTGVTIGTAGWEGSRLGGIGLSIPDVKDTEFYDYWATVESQVTQICTLLDAGMRREYIAHEFRLSAREKETLQWLAAGLRPDQIAFKLNIGYRTVDKYINSAKCKLKARTRDQAIARALLFNVIDV